MTAGDGCGDKIVPFGIERLDRFVAVAPILDQMDSFNRADGEGIGHSARSESAELSIDKSNIDALFYRVRFPEIIRKGIRKRKISRHLGRRSRLYLGAANIDKHGVTRRNGNIERIVARFLGEQGKGAQA